MLNNLTDNKNYKISYLKCKINVRLSLHIELHTIAIIKCE
ncbi:unnamed protein product [marine sediment metagenome]|uniref:Uncharacterized protein n=1 Tax=marine sediment metagenome TaxID=412755 RepID=X1MNY5_9ZZZZ